jgi:fumarate hydratase class II
MEYRIEKDTMGQVKVPAHVYWGAQTQRSIENFKIARETNRMPIEIIRASLKKQPPSPIRRLVCCLRISVT